MYGGSAGLRRGSEGYVALTHRLHGGDEGGGAPWGRHWKVAGGDRGGLRGRLYGGRCDAVGGQEGLRISIGTLRAVMRGRCPSPRSTEEAPAGIRAVTDRVRVLVGELQAGVGLTRVTGASS